MKVFFTLLFSLLSLYVLPQANCIVLGKVVNENGKVIELVNISFNQQASHAFTNKYGEFEFILKKENYYTLKTRHLAHESYFTQFYTGNKDTLHLKIVLKERINLLDGVDVVSSYKPETLVGKPDYSVYDFDFFEDKLLLLTAKKSLQKAEVRLADYSGKIYSSHTLPIEAGEAKGFFHDYLGYTLVICTDSVFRLEVINNLIIANGISKQQFETAVQPIKDTANNNLYYSDQFAEYPLFNYNYFSLNNPDNRKILNTVTDPQLMDMYRMEYYFLPPRARLEVNRIAKELKVDKAVVAAIMSGFTKSMFYQPLYAPLFIIKDTICVFNHYSNFIYHYSNKNKLIDSVEIKYHHPKNWKTWKKQLYFDEAEMKVYALYKNGANVQLKRINYKNGKVEGSYKFQNPTATQIKIKDGYAYYIYRPFESTQEKYLYRETLRLSEEN